MAILSENSSAVAKEVYFRVVNDGSLEDVKTMVLHGADINWREDSGDGNTGLCVAVAEKPNLLEFLLSKGADVNLGNKHGFTPLIIACSCGLPAIVERLSQVPGINLNPREDSIGATALMIAVDNNNLQCVEKLRAMAGVDWNAVEMNGYSAIMRAVVKGNVDAVEALLSVSTLDLNITASNGVSLAHLAVVSPVNSLRILQLLCQDGRVVWNINTGPGFPVMMALQLNKVEMFRALVRTPGVNTDITDGEGRSLLQLVR